MEECSAIQQRIKNTPIFNCKNIPVRDLVQDVLKEESSVLADCIAFHLPAARMWI